MKKRNPYKAHFFNFKKILYDFFKWSGWPLFIWFRIKKIYVNDAAKKKIRKGGALVISNHILYSDPMVLHSAFWYRRLHFVVMKELFDNKFRAFFFKNSGCIPVDREKPSLKTLREIVQRLEGGNMIAIFPEGHISWGTNPMSPFKSGAVLMAYQANVPIIPVYREIRENVWKRQRIVYGEPINLREKFGENMGMDKIEEATKYLFEKEQELKEVYKRGK